MSNPGNFCTANPMSNIPRPLCDNHTNFADLAASHLRGKKVLLYGNSVTAEHHFAAMCDMRRRGHHPSQKIYWPSQRIVYYKLPWHRGVTFDRLGNLNLTFITNYQWAGMGFCQERERALERATKGTANASLVVGRFCREFWEAVAAEFDVIIATIAGIEYKHRPLLEEDVSAILAVLGPAAAANASKRFILTDNAKQHFVGRTDSGLYEDRDEEMTAKGCFCAPARFRNPSPLYDWRNAALYARLKPFPALRSFSWYTLTLRQWDMHIARAHPEHAKPPSLPPSAASAHVDASWNGSATARRAALPKPGSAGSVAVCDCTHFCYKPAFWSGAFFPELQKSLS